MRIGRPSYLRDTALSVGFGLLAGLPLAAVAVAADYPEWIETLLSFLVVFSFFFLVGLTIRGIPHVGFVQVNHGRQTPPDIPLETSLAESLPWMRFGVGSAGAAAVLALALYLGNGDLG